MSGETLLNFRSFLITFGSSTNKTILDSRWGQIPVLSLLKTAFSLGAAICAVIDNLIKWTKLRPEQARLAFKKLQWDVLIQLLDERFLPSQVVAWHQMQQHLLERYNWKLQKELLRGQAQDAAKVALFRQHMAHISANQIAAFLSDKRQRHLQRLYELHANACNANLRVAFQAEIDTFQHLSAHDFANYRSTLADNRYHRCCADVAKTSCTIASKAFKAVLNLTCLGLEFFSASTFLFIPKYLSLVHKMVAFVFDILIEAYFKAGEELLLLSALPGEPQPFLALRRRMRYLQAA